jgi:sec-independent protein translocase protein TatA
VGRTCELCRRYEEELMLALLGPLGLPELFVILLIVLLIFGYKRIGQLGKGLGEGIRNFKDSIRSTSDEESEEEPGKKPSNSA